MAAPNRAEDAWPGQMPVSRLAYADDGRAVRAVERDSSYRPAHRICSARLPTAAKRSLNVPARRGQAAGP